MLNIKHPVLKEPQLSYLSQTNNQKKLHALLDIYEIYMRASCYYLNNPVITPENKELNIFYMQVLIPAIKSLASDLRLDPITPGDEIKLPTNYILITNLLTAPMLLENAGKNKEEAKEEISYIYGLIKELVEQARAVLQKPIKEIEKVINNTRELINKSYIAQVAEEAKKRDDHLISVTIKIGPLEYKNRSIYYNQSQIRLSPQQVSLCRVFLETSLKEDMFISDEKIIRMIAKSEKLISIINLEKAVSKLRQILKKENRKIDIKRTDGSGYIFITKYIR